MLFPEYLSYSLSAFHYSKALFLMCYEVFSLTNMQLHPIPTAKFSNSVLVESVINTLKDNEKIITVQLQTSPFGFARLSPFYRSGVQHIYQYPVFAGSTLKYLVPESTKYVPLLCSKHSFQ